MLLECSQSMNETRKDEDDLQLVSEENWLNYFLSLHSNKPLNSNNLRIEKAVMLFGLLNHRK